VTATANPRHHMSRRLRCFLRKHSWRATITAGGRSVLVSCRRCTTGPDLVPITSVRSDAMPTRPAASVLYDAWSGQLTGPIAVDVAEVLALAIALVGVAVKPGEDPRRILDVLALAHLDPDRNPR
jgi:hypothetical protein